MDVKMGAGMRIERRTMRMKKTRKPFVDSSPVSGVSDSPPQQAQEQLDGGSESQRSFHETE